MTSSLPADAALAASVQLPPGYDLRLLGDVDSTNAEAARILRDCTDDALARQTPLWISAVSQSAGRGRRGRSWASPAGNLHATLLLRPEANAAITPQLSLVAGLAVRDAVISLVANGGGDIALKWPNDVLAGGAKLAGILLESHPASPRRSTDAMTGRQDAGWVAIGIGVNLLHFPADVPYPATSLRALGAAPQEPLEMLCALARCLDARLNAWNRGAGFASLRAEWMACAYGLGEAVCMGLGCGAGEMRGIFLGLDAGGALRLRLADGGECSLCAADVRFLRTEALAATGVGHA